MDNHVPILVVSSDLKNRHALLDILNRSGWNAICASTVGECQETLSGGNFGLVFCERRLADGTYREVLSMTRSLSQGPHVRLVVTSRLADWDEYLEALHDGAFDLIASPSQTADIVRVINQVQREDQKTGARAVANLTTASAGASA